MTRHVATWALTCVIALLMAAAIHLDLPDDAAEVVAADVSDAITAAKVAAKDMK